mmetsp:Transcript_4313/g.12583  ORF Transcript_4313/g.12583 Transcript_4313/m.12583 type:complete len:235 (+) Transcript_4313:1012-1716(+)
MSNSALRNWFRRCCCVAASSLTSLRSVATCSRREQGGTNVSPSSRRSLRQGLKTSWSSCLSSDGSSDTFDQKALPRKSFPVQLPTGCAASASVAAERSNLSRARSTPLGTPGAPTANSGTVPRAEIMRAVSVGTRAAVTFAGATRPTRPARSRPSSTPPYTASACVATPPSAPWIRPSATWSWAARCSFQIWGTSLAEKGCSVPWKAIQELSSLASLSTRNLASTVALASSRRW